MTPKLTWEHVLNHVINVLRQIQMEVNSLIIGKLVGGGILRDKEGKLLMAFTTPHGKGTNNKADIESFLIWFNLANGAWLLEHFIGSRLSINCALDIKEKRPTMEYHHSSWKAATPHHSSS